MSRKIGFGARTRVVAPGRGLWVEVDPGFYVGNDRRRFLGSISRTGEDGFTAFGPHSEFVGSFTHLDDAKAAVFAISEGAGAQAEERRGQPEALAQ